MRNDPHFFLSLENDKDHLKNVACNPQINLDEKFRKKLKTDVKFQ